MTVSWNQRPTGIMARVRRERPLIHNVTNMVVTNLTANVTLAVVASAVMAQAAEEVREMVRLAGALVINMGTPGPDLVAAMLAAGEEANRAGVPVILDPVGVGATGYRLRTVATAAALGVYGYAAELAADGAEGPASFQVRLLDILFRLTPEKVINGGCIAQGG